MEKKDISRRRFQKNLGTFMLGSAGLVFYSSISGCSDDGNPAAPNNSQASNGPFEIALSSQPALQNVGGAANVSLGGVPATVFRLSETSFKTLSRVCTHQGCTTNWQSGSKKFHCNCHGSEFDQNGKVLQGPATTSLDEFTTVYDASAGKLTITI